MNVLTYSRPLDGGVEKVEEGSFSTEHELLERAVELLRADRGTTVEINGVWLNATEVVQRHAVAARRRDAIAAEMYALTTGVAAELFPHIADTARGAACYRDADRILSAYERAR